MEPLTRVRKVQSINNLDDVINEHIGELESQGKIIKHIKFIDECVAFIIYEIRILAESIKPEVSS